MVYVSLFPVFMYLCRDAGADLSVEFPVRDLETDKSGVLQVCMDGISLLLDKTKVRFTCLALRMLYVCS